MEIEKLFIDENNTILEAMAQMDQAARKILFIQKEGKLAATLTDGDIRRWILSGGSLKEKVKKAANYSPRYLTADRQYQAEEMMKQHLIEAVPIVNEDGALLSVIFWNEENVRLKQEKVELPVVMMAGGLGTRLYPYTKILPKPLIPVGEIPIAERIMNQFHKYGCDRFYLVVNHKKNMIKAYFNEIERDYEITYVDEEKPLGTGGGVSLLKGKIDQTFILTNCDILIEEDFSKIYEYHRKEKNLITMVCSLKNYSIPYGVVNIGNDGTIESMQEKPVMSFFTNTGCYIVEPRVIEEMEEQKCISFPDVIAAYKNSGEKVGVYPIGEHAWLDMGQMDAFEEMRSRLE